MAGSTSNRCPAKLKAPAVRRVAERPEGEAEYAAMQRVATLLGVTTAESVRKWVRKAEIDAGERTGVTSVESEEIKRLKAGERRAQAGERDLEGGVGILRGRVRPATRLIVDFIRSHADVREDGGLRWGVEPICTVLSEHGVKIAPSTYYDLVDRSATASEYREALLANQIRDVHAANYGVFGARKMWIVLNRMGVQVARCTVERLMREAGLAGAVRGKVKRTTIADRGAGRHPDLGPTTF